jgi:Hint domain
MSETAKQDVPLSLARRHLLALGASAIHRVAATGTLATFALTSLSSSASAQKASGGTTGGTTKTPGDTTGGTTKLCFLAGTRIRTPQGETCIEDLKIGDQVVTTRQEAQPIKWIGRQVFKKSGTSWAEDFLPIRVSRFALDAQTPHTDLYLSPWHSLLIDGFLMPVTELVNGVSIRPAMPPGRQIIEYFNILLDSHEVILAEGAPAETICIRTGEEVELFTNFIEYERLYGGALPLMGPFAPMCYHAGGRAHLSALARLGVSNISRAFGKPLDLRDPAQIAYERIAARADNALAAAE